MYGNINESVLSEETIEKMKTWCDYTLPLVGRMVIYSILSNSQWAPDMKGLMLSSTAFGACVLEDISRSIFADDPESALHIKNNIPHVIQHDIAMLGERWKKYGDEHVMNRYDEDWKLLEVESVKKNNIVLLKDEDIEGLKKKMIDTDEEFSRLKKNYKRRAHMQKKWDKYREKLSSIEVHSRDELRSRANEYFIKDITNDLKTIGKNKAPRMIFRINIYGAVEELAVSTYKSHLDMGDI